MAIGKIASKTEQGYIASRTLNDETGAIGDAVIVVSNTRRSKQNWSDGIERPEDRSKAPNPQVVEGDIFATSNSLKSHGGRKLLSPFSNIRAVTSKLCTHARPTAAENPLALRSRTALKSA
jgi:hypothetical protein